MMSFTKLAVYSALVGYFLFAHSAVAQSPFGHTFQGNTKPRDNVVAGRWGELYGTISYRIGKPGAAETKRNTFLLQRLSETVAQAFGRKTGHFVLTLEAKQGDTVLASKPILTYSWQNKKVLFFTTQTSVSSTTNFSGTLLDPVVVSRRMNNISVSLKAYHSDETKLDFAILQKLSSMATAGNIKSAFLSPVAKTVYSEISGLVKGIFENSSVRNVTQATELSFIKPSQHQESRNFRSATATIDFRNSRDRKRYKIPVSINLRTVASQVAQFVIKGGVRRFHENTFPSPVLEQADRVSGVEKSDGGFLGLLARSADEDTRELVTKLNLKAGYTDDDIGFKCEKVRGTIEGMFSQRDAKVVYWAFLHRYQRKIAKNSAGTDCLDKQTRSELKLYGLDTTDVLIK